MYQTMYCTNCGKELRRQLSSTTGLCGVYLTSDHNCNLPAHMIGASHIREYEVSKAIGAGGDGGRVNPDEWEC